MAIKTTSIALLGVAILASSPALADISWNYAQIGLERTDIDVGGGSADGFGFRLEGSYGFDDNLFVFGGYTNSELEIGTFETDFDVLTAGVGLHSNASTTMQYFGQLAIVDFKGSGGSESGVFAALGVRNEFNAQFEGKAALEYFDPLDGSELGLLLEGFYELNEEIGFTLDLRLSDEITRIGLNFRAQF